MGKKVIALLTIIFIMAAFSFNSFANKTSEGGGTWKDEAEKKLEDIMKSKDTESTEQFLVEITKPERHGLFYQREKEATLAWL
ncbi:MAG TPA: hypothetical protein GXX14_09405, partial [Clostridiaceae bacterium]|nr:hypothetical protein [Clostridiaceae bacterium]